MFSIYIFILLILYVVHFILFVYFFFFKQKTAYEMRISDWSSDVCSSDLLELEISGLALLPDSWDWAALPLVRPPPLAPAAAMPWPWGGWAGRGEIGRASCRERVCQYV